MNPFYKALEEGYSEDEVLNFLGNSFPKLRRKITKAISSGYAAKEIIGFFSNLTEGEKPSKYRTPVGSESAAHARNRQEDIEKNRKLVKSGLQLAAGAAGGALAARGISNVAPKLTNLLSGRGLPKSPGPAPLSPAAQGMAPPVPTPPSAPQPVAPPTLPSVSKKTLKESLENSFNSLKQSGETITPRTSQLIANNLSKEHGIPMKDAMDAVKMFAEKDKQSFSPPSLKRQVESGMLQEEPVDVAPKEKNVLLPNGQMGKLVEERQGIGSVELPSGEIRRKKIDELVEEPEEAAVKALELIKSFTPEQERSSHHAVSFYDPEENEAYFLFHDGSAYQVGDIDQDEYERISTEVEMAKTTGKTPYGAYAAGEGSRGAAYNKIVKDMKKPYKKLHVGYNILKEWQRLIYERQKKERKKSK